MTTKSGAASEEPRSVITEEQWGMPVTFDEAGKPVTLREYASGGRVYIPIAGLSADQWLALAVARIEMQADYELTSLSTGRVTKQRAVDEIRAKTRLGLRLAQIEKRVIVHLTGEVAKLRS